MCEKLPVLGIVQLDESDGRMESAVESTGRGAVMPFMVDDPSCWHVPLRKTVALGADAVSNKIPTLEASRGIVDAARRLDGNTQMIIGNCGYMWASRAHLYGQTSTPTLTSSLEFLDLALRITKLPVGIVTWDVKPLAVLLQDHPGFERLRFVNVHDLPDWNAWGLDPCGNEQPCGWSKEGMAQQFAERLGEAFAEGGAFNDIGILILECTLVPDFRKTIRAVTSVPVIDLLHFAKAILK